jgi:hypothetical protein
MHMNPTKLPPEFELASTTSSVCITAYRRSVFVCHVQDTLTLINQLHDIYITGYKELRQFLRLASGQSKLCTVHVVQLTGRGGLYCCETSRFPHSLDNRLTDGGDVVSLKRRQHFTPQKDSWYSFLLEAESTPLPYWGWKGYVNWRHSMTSSWIEPATF